MAGRLRHGVRAHLVTSKPQNVSPGDPKESKGLVMGITRWHIEVTPTSRTSIATRIKKCMGRENDPRVSDFFQK